MNKTIDNSYIERLIVNQERQKLLIASGAVFQAISNSLKPISSVEIAIELQIATPLVNNVLAQLKTDNLVRQNHQGDWETRYDSDGNIQQSLFQSG